MKIVFMGTPDFSVPCLEELIDKGHDVEAVFTQPDKPKGRGYKLVPPPVKRCAQEHDIEVYQPLSLRKGGDAQRAMEVLEGIAPDVIIVVAYGQILPKSILKLPKYGCINIHASLLPKYRGAAPIQRCILEGEEKTGVTSMMMEEGLDTGDMLLKGELKIGGNETASELHDRLSALGADILIKTLEALENGTLEPKKQDDSKSSYAERITKELSLLDFTRPAAEVHNTIRGVTGFTQLFGKRLKVYKSVLAGNVKGEAGTVVNEKNFTVACGDGKGVTFLEVQYEGSKRMTADSFLRGRRLEAGQKLG